MPLVFAYGSLLRGESNAHYLEGARFLGSTRTSERFTLYSFGEYPALCEGGEFEIEGELYEVDAVTLARLDELEEYPGYYERREIALSCGRRALCYLLPRTLAERDGGRPLPHGDWKKRMNCR